MKKLKYLLAIATIAALPIYLVANEAVKTDSVSISENIPNKISKDEKKVVDEIKAFRASLSDSVNKELDEFAKAKAEMRVKNRELYNKLSDDAKKAMKEESKKMKKLGFKTRKLITEERE